MPDNLQVNSTTDQGSAEHEDASNVAIYDAQANLHRSSQFGLPYGGLYPHYMQMHGNPSLMYTPGFYGDDRYSNSMDFSNGFRRKNATKETTSALKAWLIEHKKNPYPTKGEKIMLAILTRMTLTQISTWFANARRRLKKENKMTWSPRTCCGKNDEDCRSRKAVADSSGQSSRPTGGRRSPCDSDDDSDDDDRDDKKNPGSSKSVGKRPIENAQVNGALDKKKPKIWSIAETVATTVSRKNPIAPLCTSASVVSHTAPFHLVFPPWPRMAAGPLTSSSQQSSFLFRPELLFQNLTDVFAMQANRKDENVSKTSANSHVSSTTMITKDLEPTSSSSTSR